MIPSLSIQWSRLGTCLLTGVGLQLLLGSPGMAKPSPFQSEALAPRQLSSHGQPLGESTPVMTDLLAAAARLQQAYLTHDLHEGNAASALLERYAHLGIHGDLLWNKTYQTGVILYGDMAVGKSTLATRLAGFEIQEGRLVKVRESEWEVKAEPFLTAYLVEGQLLAGYSHKSLDDNNRPFKIQLRDSRGRFGVVSEESIKPGFFPVSLLVHVQTSTSEEAPALAWRYEPGVASGPNIKIVRSNDEENLALSRYTAYQLTLRHSGISVPQAAYHLQDSLDTHLRASMVTGAQPQDLQALAREIRHLSLQPSSRERPIASVEAYRKTLDLLHRIGVLPGPGDGDLVSIAGGIDLFPFEWATGYTLDRESFRTMELMRDAFSRALRRLNLGVDQDSLERQYQGNLSLSLLSPFALEDAFRRVLPSFPRVFLLKFTEFWVKASMTIPSSDAKSAIYESALRSLVAMSPAGTIFITFELASDTVTPRVFRGQDSRFVDVLAERLPAEAYEALRQAGDGSPIHFDAGTKMIWFGGSVHAYQRAA